MHELVLTSSLGCDRRLQGWIIAMMTSIPTTFQMMIKRKLGDCQTNRLSLCGSVLNWKPLLWCIFLRFCKVAHLVGTCEVPNVCTPSPTTTKLAFLRSCQCNCQLHQEAVCPERIVTYHLLFTVEILSTC